METIVFPDAVATCRTVLAAQFVAAGDTDTHVGHQLGDGARQVVLTLLDASITNLVIQTSVVRVDCWADETLGPEAAHDIGQLARAFLGAMKGTRQGDVSVYQVTDAQPGLNDDPDPISGKARYSFHVAVSLRGTALVPSS